MERIEYAIDLVHYEPPRSGQPLNSLQWTYCSDPIEPLSIIVLLNSGSTDGLEATPIFVASDVITGAMT